MSQNLKNLKPWNTKKSEKSDNLKYHKVWTITKSEMSQSLKFHQVLNVTKIKNGCNKLNVAIYFYVT